MSGSLVQYTAGGNPIFPRMALQSGKLGGEATTGSFPLPPAPRNLNSNIIFPKSGVPTSVDQVSSSGASLERQSSTTVVADLRQQLRGRSPSRGELIFTSRPSGVQPSSIPVVTLTELNRLLRQNYRTAIVAMDNRSNSGVTENTKEVIEKIRFSPPSKSTDMNELDKMIASLKSSAQTWPILCLSAPMIEQNWCLLGFKSGNKSLDKVEIEPITVAVSSRVEVTNYWGSNVQVGNHLWLVLTRNYVTDPGNYEKSPAEYMYKPVKTNGSVFLSRHAYQYRDSAGFLRQPSVFHIGRVVNCFTGYEMDMQDATLLSAQGLVDESPKLLYPDAISACQTITIDFAPPISLGQNQCP